MSLVTELAKAKSEEDVKDAYIKALGLKSTTKGLIDIRTDEIWFEAKAAHAPPVLMFAQLLFYVRDARKKGERIPPFLAVIDREKAAIMETAKALPIMTDKTITWPKSASAVDKKVAAQAAPYIETHFVVFKLDSHEKEFIATVKKAIKDGKLVRTPITPANLRQVFDTWVEMIGKEIEGVSKSEHALLFFADIMHDGIKAAMANLPARLLHEDDRPVFLLNGKTYELSSDRGYRKFWTMYHRPPEEEYRGYLLERRDSLLPLDERSFKGAFYTPLVIVDKAYNLLAESLGQNWQKNYVVWDMCCGVGNLEVKHSNHRNIFMSTLDTADIEVMTASLTCVAATKFQYDYLNDDITDAGEIDYSLSKKLPAALQEAIAAAKEKRKGAKKILVLINPPYGETGSGIGKGDTNKKGIEKSKINAQMKFGYASKELFVQFLARIQKELPNATLAMFSKLKYVVAPNFETFRANWQAEYLGGFAVHSKAFDGIKGDFPIGFLIWDTSKKKPITTITTQALTKTGEFVGVKDFTNGSASTYLNKWITPPGTNDDLALPLSNAFTISTNPRLKKSCDSMIGYLYASNNDLQHAGQETLITSSIYTGGNGGGLYITKDNLLQCAIVFSVRRLVKPTWLNDRDQFLQPTKALPDEFKSDCLVWMLFNGSNLTAGCDGLEWNDKKWTLVNHFVPFTEIEMGATKRLESSFMSDYLAKLKLSGDAKALLGEAKKIWKTFHATRLEKRIRDEFMLNRSDAGWYQVRRALKANSENEEVDFSPFEDAYETLTLKLRPKVFELGFLL
ncbi:hypothetical protein [Caballeronia sp. DA-9]|uniref:hypothetical protein n=1 Tax=Caballeronia sp. DA-9 TaxID=3436237 RepID=UPI003F680EE4